MVSCAVASCKNSSGKSTKRRDGISFHRFPQDEKRRKIWEIAVNREAEWVSTDSSAVCSQHFEAKEFYFTESGLRRLLTEAVPSINISSCEDTQPTISDMEHVDIKPKDSEEVVQLKYKVRRLEVIALHRKKQMNLMSQTKKRMQRKLDRMRFMIEHLIRSKDEDKENT